MGRPTDWDVLDLDRDPVPGDPYEVKELAGKLGAFADDVATALRSVRGLGGDTVIQSWAGLSGDAYREQFGDLPGELDKLERSYRLASGALDDYWPQLETAQADADRALAQGRQARADLDAAKSQLTNADAWVKRAQDKSKQYQDDPKPGVPPPSEQDVRDAARNATAASNAHTTASTAVHDAQSRLDAAKELAAQAAGVRDTAASTAEHALHEASDAGIHNKHWWEKAVDWVADHWDDIVAACKIIVAVLGIVVMIIGGPLAWLVLAAAVIVLADTVSKYLQGKASLWDVAFAALDCIPMFKGLTTAGGLLKMARELPTLLKSGEALERIANSVRKGAGSIRSLSRDIKTLFTCGDPIDMATGEMVMSAVDVELPGVLPLVLERHHRSGFRGGRWFGRSWASTLDQRLLLDEQGVRFTTADGMVLHYTVPEPGLATMPVEGPRWPLTWNGAPGDAMTVEQPETGRTLEFRAGPHGDLPLTAITDRNTNRIAVTYDEHGVPTEVAHSGGYRIAVTTQDARITALHLASAGDRPRILTFGYTGGNLTAVTNSSGRPLRLAYDDAGRITRWQDRNDHWYAYTYDDRGRCVRTDGTDGILAYTYTYHDAPRVTDAVNSLGHTTTFAFNDHYQLIAQTDPLGHTTHHTWDRYDHLTSITDPLGHTTTYTYDTHGNPTTITHPDGSAHHAQFNAFGQPVSITTADGVQWLQTYDERGNATNTTEPTKAVTEAVYDSRGGLIGLADALGNVRRFTVSAAGLPIAAAGDDGFSMAWERDAFGRVVAEHGPQGVVTRMSWSLEGRMTSRSLPDGSTERWTYDGEGNLLEYRDVLGAVTTCEPGPFERPAVRVGPDGSRTRFRYDTELRLVEVANAAGLRWTYDYDAVGRVVAETDFNGRATAYKRDGAGRLIERTNGAGQRLYYERDAVGRLIGVRGDDCVRTTFSYDASGRLIGAEGESTLLIERDAAGRVTRETVDGRTVASRYDVLGRRIERHTPSGRSSTWSYLSDGPAQPASMTLGERTLDFTYDAAGRETSRALSDVFKLTQTWSDGGRLTGQSITASGLSRQMERGYTYRADGRLIGDRGFTAGARSFRLDAIGRVTGVDTNDGRSAESYIYDSMGNVGGTSIPPEGAAVDDGWLATGTLIRRSGRSSYDYDRQGRVVRHTRRLPSGGRRTWTYAWDAQDRMTEVVAPDGNVWRYAYDPLGRRVAKRRMAGTSVVEETLFVWDGTGLAERLAGNSATTWEYAPGTHRPIAQYDDTFHAVVTDLVGMPTELVDEHGTVTWQAARTVWGSEPNPGSEPGAAGCPLRFPGQYADAETGLYYNHLRYYDPETAHYQSPDPLGLLPSPNHHAYVDNPYDEIDPLGLSACSAAARALKPGEMYLYRAVQQKELEQLLKTRRFENIRGIETKYFSTTMEGAAAYARAAFRAYKEEGPYTLVRAVIHQDKINPESLIEHLADAGGGIDALALSTEEMTHAGRVRILPFMPVP